MSKHNQVKQYIIDKIENNTYTEGNIIDSTTTLKNELHVSMMTIRTAIQDLVEEGILYTEKGRGTFVSFKTKYAQFHCGTAFTKEIENLGMIPSTTKAEINKVKASKQLSTILQIEENTYVWEIIRVRAANGEPVLHAREYFIYDNFPTLTLEHAYKSVYGYFESQGTKFHHADQKLEAVSGSLDVTKSLNIKAGSPLLKMTLISMTQSGRIFSYSIEHFLTDRFNLTQTIYAK